jgi:uncharacterized protein YdaU (DUF1376 family)
MAKDPAFLMYSKDWLTGTQFMSMEERGIYITLVLAQHQNGHLDPKRVGFLLGFGWDMVPVIVKEKFETDGAGMIFNKRLEEEREKRDQYLSKQKENGQKGGRPKKPKENPDHNPNSNPKKSTRVANGNGNEDVIEDRKEGVEEREGIQYPYESETFKANWMAWRNFLHEKYDKDYFNRTAEQAALMHLSRISKSEDHAIQTIQKALRNGWQDLYTLKIEDNGNKNDGLNHDQLTELIEREAAKLRSNTGQKD